jgi:anaerobic magnesium-protoporphyrin IX monomethyl ester cyclase
MNVVLVCHKYGVSISDPCAYPIGFMMISSVLKQQGHTVKVLNYNLWDYDLLTEITDQDAVLFTGFEEFLPLIIRDAAICRNAGVHTVLGGALATYLPDEMLKHVDAVVVNEGELVIDRALTHYGVLIGLAPDVNRLPLPDYDGFGIEEYHNRHAVRYMGVLTTRGCPYSCRFCAHTCSYQRRNLASVFQEIDYYKQKYGIEAVVFNDNTLNVDKQRFMVICDGMRSRNIRWSAAIRADVFDDEMATAFKNSGGEYFVIGVESFRQDKLDAMNKRVTVGQITRTLDILHSHDIGYHGNVLLGLPGESYDDIQSELTTIPERYNVFPVLVQPFVGTKYQTRDITADQAAQLNHQFLQQAQNRGMNCYPMS